MVKKNIKSKLKLLNGRLQCEMWFGTLRIVASPEHSPPFKVDAMAFEEDTWLVMSADPKVCEPEKHPIRLMTDLIEAQPEPVGSVLVKGKNPLRFLAIVHDLNLDPTWREKWIESALEKIFYKAEQLGLKAIGLQLLGTLHGRLDKKRFIDLLGHAIFQASLKHLKRLWLIAPIGANNLLIKKLKSILNEKHGNIKS